MHRTKRLGLLVIVFIAGFAVVGGAQARKAAASKKPRVWFVTPKNNANVSSPVHMEFAAEGIEIAAVPPGDITTARPGKAHYHVGIDQDCLPPNKNIVKGTPSWVHFGDGKNVFDSQLTPGKHKLALQLGDDLHNTLPGTCQAITVNVK